MGAHALTHARARNPGAIVVLGLVVVGLLLTLAPAASAAARDRDHNRIPDSWQQRYHLGIGRLVAKRDLDNDGLTALREYRARTHPRVADTDRDGLTDGVEVLRAHSNPRMHDTDADGVSDRDEFEASTNPRDPREIPVPAALDVTTSSPVIAEGGSVTMSLQLSARPASSVLVLLAPTGVAVSSNRVLITPDTWNTPTQVHVTAANDFVARETSIAAIAIATRSAAPRFNMLVPAPAPLVVLDDDHAGVDVQAPATPFTLEERRVGQSVSVGLTSQPTAPVTVAVDGGTDVTASPATVAWTPDNWRTRANVRLQAPDDGDTTPSRIAHVHFHPTSDDTTYAALVANDLDVSIVDDQAVSIDVVESGGSRVDEGVGSDTFTIALHAKPTSDVALALLPSPGLAISPVGPIIFTPLNWNQPITITVTAPNDDVAGGTRIGTVSMLASSADERYDQFAPAPVDVTVSDTDIAGVDVSPTSPLSLTEGGATRTYDVALRSRPLAAVSIVLAADTGLTVSPGSLTFDPSSWDTPQTVTVGVVDDTVSSVQRVLRVRHVAASLDPSYDLAVVGSVQAVVTDDDLVGVVVTPSGGATTVTEGGATDTYTLALASQPNADVTIAYAATPTNQVTFSPAGSVTFTPMNWSQPRTVIVTAVNDGVAEAQLTTTIAHTVSSNDLAFDGLSVPTVPVTVNDNDTVGVTVADTGGSTQVTEGGATDTHTVTLGSRPRANVTVTPQSTSGRVTFSPASAVIDPNTWSTPRTFTVSAVNDTVFQGAPAIVSIATRFASTDADYNNFAAASLSATVTDNDVPPHDARVVVDRTTMGTVSRLKLGWTYDQCTFRADTNQCGKSSTNSTAIANAQSLLAGSPMTANVQMYQWGNRNPNKSPGVYDYTDLDKRIRTQLAGTNQTPIITLCCSPDWMSGGNPGDEYTDFSYKFPKRANWPAFQTLVRNIVMRYPEVDTYVIWNEFKGLYCSDFEATTCPDWHHWDYVAYTDFYNQTYATIQQARIDMGEPPAQIGGPYPVIPHLEKSKAEGSFDSTNIWSGNGYYDARPLEAMKYWLGHNVGADFMSWDGATNTLQPPTGTPVNSYDACTFFSTTDALVRSWASTYPQAATIPMWWSEWYPRVTSGGTLDGVMARCLLEHIKGGTAMALYWGPEAKVPGILDSWGGTSLWTGTVAGGGQRLSIWDLWDDVRTNFGDGTQLVGVTTEGPIAAIASAHAVLVVNQSDASLDILVDDRVVTVPANTGKVVTGL